MAVQLLPKSEWKSQLNRLSKQKEVKSGEETVEDEEKWDKLVRPQSRNSPWSSCTFSRHVLQAPGSFSRRVSLFLQVGIWHSIGLVLSGKTLNSVQICKLGYCNYIELVLTVN